MKKGQFKEKSRQLALRAVKGVFGSMYLTHSYFGDALLGTESYLVHKLDKEQHPDKIQLDRIKDTQTKRKEIRDFIDDIKKDLKNMNIDLSESGL